MNCKHYKIRRKNYVRYIYCTTKKRRIEHKECYHCIYKEYKKMSTIKPVSKKRVTVSSKTYLEVLERDKSRCRLCGRTWNVQLHHILYRSERKDLIDEPTNCIMLCVQCHSLVHTNKKKYQPMLQELVKKRF